MSSNLQPISNDPIHADSTPAIDAVIEQLSTVLIGKEQQLRLALACLISRGHLLIEDVPGVGKTTLAHAIGATMGLPWNRVQFTSDLLPADVLGVSIYNAVEHTFEFKPGPVFTSLLLADEINRAPPKAQSALLEAMEERQVTVDGQTHALPNNFFVIATQNSADQLGAYPLPESQLDRFLAGIELGYPDSESERALLAGGDRRSTISALKPIADPDTLNTWATIAASMPVSDLLLDYVQALLAETRNLYSVKSAGQTNTPTNGLSPRAGLSLLNMARAWALVRGSSKVLPEDIQAVFPAVAGHRLTGSVSSGKSLCTELLSRVSVP